MDINIKSGGGSKVLLVNSGHQRSYSYGEPLSLAFLAAHLINCGAEARIVDQLAGQDVAGAMDWFKPDLVGVTAVTPLAYDAYRVSDMARGRGIPTVLGGAHASVRPDEALEHFDMVVQGEGELALQDILEQGTRSGILRSNEIFDLDACPAPARHLLDMDYYLDMRRRHTNNPNFLFVPPREQLCSLMVSRGCYWNCSYCHNSWRDMPCRFRSPAHVVQEMNALNERFGVRYFNFMDDTLFGNRKYCRGLFSAMIENGRGYCWGGNARVDCVNEEILSLARRAGCRRINFGFESGSQRVLDALNKKVRVERISRSVRLAVDQGIQVIGTFMVGNPRETREDLDKTRRLALSLPLQAIGFSLTTAFPGTELWRVAEERGRIPERLDWTRFDFDHVPIQVSDHFSEKELIAIRKRLFIQVSLFNPSILKNMIKMLALNPAPVLQRIRRVLFTRPKS